MSVIEIRFCFQWNSIQSQWPSKLLPRYFQFIKIRDFYFANSVRPNQKRTLFFVDLWKTFISSSECPKMKDELCKRSENYLNLSIFSDLKIKEKIYKLITNIFFMLVNHTVEWCRNRENVVLFILVYFLVRATLQGKVSPV